MRKKAVLFLMIVIASATTASWFGADWAVRTLEKDTSTRVNMSLHAAGQKWARIETDGLIVKLLGEAPNETGRFRALEIAAQIVDTNRIEDETTIKSSAADQRPEFLVEILRNGRELSLIGLVPGKNERLSILQALDPLKNDGQFTDLLESVEIETPEGWSDALAFAIEITTELPKSRIVIRPKGVTVEAFLDSQGSLATTRKSLSSRKPNGIDVRFDLSAPKTIVAPFKFSAISRDSTVEIEQCWVDTQDAKLEVYSALSELNVEATCDEALGAPSSDWSAAVVASIGALASLESASIEITDTDIKLAGHEDTTREAFFEVAKRLDAELPEFFSLTATPPPAQEERQSSVVAPEFIAVLTENGMLTMTGSVRDTSSKNAADNFAAARFGQSNVETALTVSSNVPVGWSPRVLAAIDALSLLHDGSVDLSMDRLEITGRSAQEDVREILNETLRNQLKGAVFDASVTYDPALAEQEENSSQTARECERQLALILREAQIIFDPNSSTISDESEILLDEIAYIIKSCPEASFEIGGHTDSQGGDGMNLSLSQARADAVLDTLLTRDVLLRQVSAKGYGETEPIADNDSDEGRARNRRIAFKLLTSKDQANEQN